MTSDNAFKITPERHHYPDHRLHRRWDERSRTAPVGVAVDSADNVYVVGRSTATTPSRSLPAAPLPRSSIPAGDGTNGLVSPRGVAVDSADNVYVTGRSSDNAFKITPGGTITEIIDSTGDGTNGLNSPLGVAVDSADNVYVTGGGSDNAFKITPGGTITEIIDSTGDGTEWSRRRLGCCRRQRRQRLRYRGWQRQRLQDHSRRHHYPDHRLHRRWDESSRRPAGVAVDSADNVYVTGALSQERLQDHSRRHHYPDHRFHRRKRMNDRAGPQGIAVDSADNVYVTGSGSNNVFKIAPAPAPPCAGDCDHNGEIEIHELVTLVDIGLGIADVSGCEAGDRNLDGEISIDEILSAVGYGLAGCPLDPVARACLDSGGTLTTGLCCQSTDDFPDTCAIGACGCAPDFSHTVRLCDCGPAACFDGSECVLSLG